MGQAKEVNDKIFAVVVEFPEKRETQSPIETRLSHPNTETHTHTRKFAM